MDVPSAKGHLVKARVPAAVVAGLISVLVFAACGSAQGRAPRGQTAGSAAVASSSAVAASPGASGAARIRTAPCGTETGETVARTVGSAAMRIYANELASVEVTNDRHQVEGYAPLLSALESNNQAAVKQAVTRLVYSHTHVVRLRVTRSGHLLADVGGPYIIAPVHGALRRNGRTLAQYVLSVQDDLGYVKLVSRFIGVPLALSESGHTLPIEGALTGPASIPDHGPVSYRGASYQAFSFTARAFPAGVLRVSLLAPMQEVQSRESCAAVRLTELRRMGEHMWQRFTYTGASIPSFVELASHLTGAQVYVRAGTHLIAGSALPGPSKLPAHGAIRYRGAGYSVESFPVHSSAGQATVYLLARP